jgi:hypothetical protein
MTHRKRTSSQNCVLWWVSFHSCVSLRYSTVLLHSLREISEAPTMNAAKEAEIENKSHESISSFFGSCKKGRMACFTEQDQDCYLCWCSCRMPNKALLQPHDGMYSTLWMMTAGYWNDKSMLRSFGVYAEEVRYKTVKTYGKKGTNRKVIKLLQRLTSYNWKYSRHCFICSLLIEPW